ncbi:MAG: gephyrin-like molybdotransferase Glp [Tepidisphaeraceae bacterium]|jgi:molybdopterin molybdotransferase
MEEIVADLLTVAQAIAIIDALPVHPRTIRVPLADASGLRLAAAIIADRDYPPFDKSMMDGYAVRAADVAKAPVDLQVIGESPAGRAPSQPIGAGQAMTIMTGAPLPPGADAVVPIERTASKTFAAPGERVRVLHSASPGASISPRGSDISKGATVLPIGIPLGPAQLAVASSVGAANVDVFDRPRCAVLATGDEIVSVDQTPPAATIRNSNNPMLVNLLTRLGCVTRDRGVARDDPAVIKDRLLDALRDDIVFVTGGMSMGQYDFVPRILLELGADLKITKLRIRPGKPFVLAAMPEGKYVVGLPGNPVSAFVCTLRLAARLLRRMSGGSPEQTILNLPVSAPLSANGPREFYQPAILIGDAVRPIPWKGSADIFTLARADALVIRPENAPPLGAGQNVPVMLLP